MNGSVSHEICRWKYLVAQGELGGPIGRFPYVILLKEPVGMCYVKVFNILTCFVSFCVPPSLLGGDRGSTFPAAPGFNGRHLLGFSPESEKNFDSNKPQTDTFNPVNR